MVPSRALLEDRLKCFGIKSDIREVDPLVPEFIRIMLLFQRLQCLVGFVGNPISSTSQLEPDYFYL